MTGRVLVVRQDSAGDVLLAGPAVRAIAGAGAEVVLLAGPRGAAAADLLPGVARVLVHECPWIDAPATAVRADSVDALVAEVAELAPRLAVLLTSFHQSPLPTALLLRLAGVPRIVGASVDYPGSLLDVRLRPGERGPDGLDENQPETLRAQAIVAAAGFRLPPGDDGRLAVKPTPPVDHLVGSDSRYVVVHPGAAVPARAWPVQRCAEAVRALAATGYRVVVTGGPDERGLTSAVAGRYGLDLGGRTDLPHLAGVLAGADAVVVGNTGPAHLAAAVGTPVVSLFAPVVPASRWAPYGVPHVLLGDQDAPCRDSRARECPVPGHPCLSGVHAGQVLDAVRRLVPDGPGGGSGGSGGSGESGGSQPGESAAAGLLERTG